MTKPTSRKSALKQPSRGSNYYTKLNRQAPAERDMQIYFQVSPPAVHDMIVKLEKHGFINREPGVPRSIWLLLTREELPHLE